MLVYLCREASFLYLIKEKNDYFWARFKKYNWDGHKRRFNFTSKSHLQFKCKKEYLWEKKEEIFVKFPTKVAGIAFGQTHTAAWDTDGAIYTWGEGYDGRLGHPIEYGK